MLTDYTRDFLAFYRDLVPVEGAYGPRPVIPPFLARWLALAFPLPAGDPAARNVLDSRSKKQGKSATAAGVSLYMATRAKYAEVVIAAADQDQAKDRVLRAAKYAVDNGPLSKHARCYRDVIEFDNGSLVTALPSDWRGAAGGNYGCVVFDELWSYTLEGQRRLFDELVIPPTQPTGTRWIASYAGFLGESLLLKEIWDRALAGERIDDELPIYRNDDAALLALVDTGPESWRMPWTAGEAGRRYMAQQEATERPNTYHRLYLNEWTAAESSFVTPEQWATCRRPATERPAAGALVLGADASTSRDLTALVGCQRGSGGIQVPYVRVWRPERGDLRGGKPTIALEATIGAEVLELHRRGRVRAVVCDPFQLHTLILAWQKVGIEVIELPQTSGRIESDQALYDAIVNGTLAHYGDPLLTEHVVNAVAVETPRGFRLAKEKTSKKIDAAVALSMAHYGAQARGAHLPMPERQEMQVARYAENQGDGRGWDQRSSDWSDPRPWHSRY